MTRRTAVAYIMVAFFLMSALQDVQAQGDTILLPPYYQHPELYTMLQDSQVVYLVLPEGDTVDADFVTPCYRYSILYDTLCSVEYLITEWKQNSKVLVLPKWREGRIANAHPSLLSFNSATSPFTCHTGDTLSFFRRVEWNDPRSSMMDTNNYYATDSLDFTVELVRLSDSTRLMVLDTIGMLPSHTPSRPVFHGMRPLMAHVKYVVPPVLNGVNTFMRVRLYHRGAGNHFFTRTDDITIELSKSLTDPSWGDYLSMFGSGMFKVSPLELHEFRNTTTLDIRIKASISNREALFEFPTSLQGGTTSVAVYDINGNVLLAPYIDVSPEAAIGSAGYRFPNSGTYFVGLFHDGVLVAVEKLAIQ